eukprot:TRINITY_DN2198_c0_g3_i3.p1 TRINITY_DN2198_c0_g3~~TRINITY_DN2198_c0_g3_i3.p1  ORF type:complete len:356 (+),score=53.82 TRINITY_DN2198_c0_g3_i3:70-1137(+)
MELNGDLIMRVFRGNEKIKLNTLIAKAPELLMMPYETLENRMTIWLHQVKCQPEAIGDDPTILCLPVSCIRDTEVVLQKLGFKITDSQDMIRRFPRIIHMNVQDMNQTLLYINSWVKDKQSVLQIVPKIPEIFAMSQNAIARRFEWFEVRGFSAKEVIKVLKDTPQLIVWGADKMEIKWRRLCGLGLKPQQVRRIVLIGSRILTKNIQGQIQLMKFKYLQMELKRNPINALLEYPRIVQHSLQERIAPRYLYLRLKHKKGHSLSNVLGCSDLLFATRCANTTYREYQSFLRGEWRTRHWPWLEERLMEAMQEDLRSRKAEEEQGGKDDDVDDDKEEGGEEQEEEYDRARSRLGYG